MTMTAEPQPRTRRPELLKCLVWDLDGTLWDGRLLDGDEPRLRAAAADLVVELDRRGIVQSIASANDHDEAWAWLERFGLAELFLAPEINFGPKHQAVQRIGRRLGIASEAIGFIDDDPLERDAVQALVPGVRVFAAEDCRRLATDPLATPRVRTVEAGNRRRMVQSELRRIEDERRSADLIGFLQSCDIEFTGRVATDADLARVAELSERTNRMNATGTSYAETDLTDALSAADRNLLVASMRDRYGEYGVVGAALLAEDREQTRVTGLWMSCRVGRRGLPAAFFTYLAEHAAHRGATRLLVEYSKQQANRLAALHLGLYGFSAVPTAAGSAYVLPIPDGIRPFEPWLRVRA